MESLSLPSNLPTNTQDIRLLQELDTKYQIQSAQERIEFIQNKLQQINANAETSLPTNNDWTQSYRNWENWNDKDELVELKSKEESKLQSLLAKGDNLGHVHSHTEEREFFQRPENEKLEVVRGYRVLGNYLVWEGSFIEAIEAYETSLGYYEYCFPESEEKQKELDEIRLACFLNVSMCYLRVREFRKSIEAATNAVQESRGTSAKAYFRRGQGYRWLDEYEKSREDLHKALELAPTDKVILEEFKYLKETEEQGKRQQGSFAGAAFQKKDHETSTPDMNLTAEQEMIRQTFLHQNTPISFTEVLPFPKPPESINLFYRYLEEYTEDEMANRV